MGVRAFGSWTSAPRMLVFQDFEASTEVFAHGRPPGYPRGRPPDIRPQNLLFTLKAAFSFLMFCPGDGFNKTAGRAEGIFFCSEGKGS